MRRRLLSAVLLSLGVANLALAGDGPASRPAALAEPARPVLRPVLEWSTFDAWRAYMHPSAGEAAWREIEWLPTFGAGIEVAGRQEKPLLLWVMNGHPLGCT